MWQSLPHCQATPPRHFTDYDWHERWDAWFELDSGKIMTTSRYTQYQQELQELQGQQEQDPEYDLSNEPGSREEIRTSRKSKKNKTQLVPPAVNK